MVDSIECEPLQPVQLLAVLAMTDRTWHTRARVVAFIGSYVGGDWFAGADVGDWCGVSSGRARVLLAELDRAKVILRAEGAGARPYWCEVNPDVLGWRGVPWTVDRRELARRLVFTAERERAATAPDQRFYARLYGARSAQVVARPSVMRAASEGATGARGPGGRDPVSIDRTGARGMGRASTTGRAVAMGSRGPAGEPLSSSRSGFLGSTRDLSTRPPGPGGQAPTAQQEVDPTDLATERRAIMRRAGASWINGRPAVVVAGLVARYPVSTILEAIAQAPTEYRVPRLVDHLADTLDAGAAAVEPGWYEHERKRLESAVAALRCTLATWEEQGAPDDAVASYRDQLARCENDLRELDRREGRGEGRADGTA